MADGLTSSTPEKSGDNKTAANAANNQGENNPIREVARPKRKTPKKFLGLTESKRRELFGIVMLIPWVWVEFSGVHSFGNLCGLAFSLAVAQYVVFSFFKVRLKGWTLPLWAISLFPVCLVVWENSRPEPKPHLAFELRTVDSKKFQLEMTNDFLVVKQWQHIRANGILITPRTKDKTNSEIGFNIVNTSSKTVEDVEVFLRVSKSLHCTGGKLVENTVANNDTNSDLFGAIFPGPLLQGDANFVRIEFLADPPNSPAFGTCLLGVRAKDMPDMALAFWLAFISPSKSTAPEIIPFPENANLSLAVPIDK